MNKSIQKVPVPLGNRKFILQSYPNLQDHFVIERLIAAPISNLPVDECARVFCKNGKPLEESHIVALRCALIRIYLETATKRLNAKAKSSQVDSARFALSSFMTTLEHLDNVSPPRLRRLQWLFGTPTDDPSGLHEASEFHLECRQIRLEAIPVMLRLCRAIESETSKPAQAGERKKRLRTLMEALANWWTTATGKYPTAYVKANRRDDQPAVLTGRYGAFLSMARALFCKIDGFTASEVDAAFTNVHEAYLKMNSKHKKQP